MTLSKMKSAAVRCRDRKRHGLSLLEVILAIAILGVSLAMIGELVRLGSRSAIASRELTKAQLHCESKMAEIVAGIEPAQPFGPTELQYDPDWLYEIEVAPTDRPGLIAVRVTVADSLDPLTSHSFSLVRWLPDPAISFEEVDADGS